MSPIPSEIQWFAALSTTLPLLLLATPAAAAPSAPSAISGQVLPAEVAAAARVVALPECPADPPGEEIRPLATARPAPDGRFRLDLSEGSRVKVRVEAEGFLPMERLVDPWAETALPPVRLHRAERLEILLESAGGAAGPLAGIPLLIEAPGGLGEEGWQPAPRRAVSGADGLVAVPRVEGERLFAVVLAPRLPGVREIPVGTHARLVLAPGRPLTLAVRDAAGKPVAGARVGTPWADFEPGRTGPDGRFELTLPTDGRGFALVVEGPDGARADLEVAAGGEVVLPVVLVVPQRIAGRVLDAATRQPVAGARVDGGSCRARAATAADGGFEVAVPRAADARVAVQASGYVPAYQPLTGGEVSLTLLLERALGLAGRVVDEKGEAVAGAQVQPRLSRHGHVGSFAEGGVASGPDGRFHLAGLAGGSYQLTVRHEGFAPAALAVRVEGDSRPVEIVMRRGVAAFGRLEGVESAGSRGREPIAGGTVRLGPINARGIMDFSQGRESHPSATSGADGRFEIRGLAPGRYRLTAEAPGRAPVPYRDVDVAAGPEPTDLGTVVLPPAAAVDGRVLDSRGRPVAGAKVWTVGAEATSGADGTFHLAGLAPGGTTLVVNHPDFPSTEVEASVPAAEPLEIRLRPARILSGRVAGTRGEPVAGATLSRLERNLTGIGGDPEWTEPQLFAHTDSQGRFHSIALEPGTLTVMVEAAGYRPRQVIVEVPEERDPAPLDITLEEGAVIEGRVAFGDGRPSVGAHVAARPDPAAGSRAAKTEGTADGDGHFRLTGLAAGPHIVTAAVPAGGQAETRVEVRPGTQRLDLTFPEGVEVAGRVTDDQGAPTAGAQVLLDGEQHFAARTEVDGSFAFAVVPAGTYRLQASLRGYADAARELQVSGEPLRGLEVTLARVREGGVAGRLLGLAPEELAGARVHAWQPFGRHVPGQALGDGGYRIHGLAPGRWNVTAQAPGRGPARGEIEVETGGEAALDLEFQRGLTLAGRVLVDGLALADNVVALQPGGSAVTGSDGGFAFHDLAPGRYILTLRGGPGGTGWTEAVELGESRSIEIQVSTGRLAGRVSAAGAPVAGVLVRVEREGAAEGPQEVTDDSGAFAFSGLPPGRFVLRVQADGRADAVVPVAVTAGAETAVEVALP